MVRSRTAVLLIWLLAVGASAVHAEPAAPPPAVTAPDQCGGKDMIAELAISDPKAHQRILDDAAKIENGEALLWKIEKNGVPTSYLFGTIHMADTRVTKLPDPVRAALSASKTIAVEIAGMSDEGMMAAMTKTPQLLAYSDGMTLPSQLTPEEFAKVQKLASKVGMPPEATTVLRPWLISMLLALSDCNRAQLEAGKKALDTLIEDDAKAAGAKIVGLETAESQLAAMASIPNDKQILILKAGLAYADRTDDMIETLVQLYINRKIAATMPFQLVLAEKIGVAPAAYDEFIKILVADRNLKMRDSAKLLLEEGGAFIAVGSLHLPGKTGLVELLRGAGYQVTAAE